MLKKLIRFRYTFLSALLIIVALLLPSSNFSRMPSRMGIDKVAHFVLFFTFTLAYCLEYRKLTNRLPGLLHGTIIVVLFIVGSELMQLLTPTRRFEVLDMLSDAVGSAVAAIVARILPEPEDQR